VFNVFLKVFLTFIRSTIQTG